MSRRSDAQKLNDRMQIANMYLRGYSQMAIAAELDISQSTVSRDIKHLFNEWLDAAAVNFDEAKARELARIDNLEVEAWQQYEASKEDFVRTVQERSGANLTEDQKGKVTKVRLTKEQRLGDVKYLNVIEWCINKRVEILALVVKRHELTGQNGGPLTVKVVYEDGS